MQQSGVRWLDAVELHNPGGAAVHDLAVAIELQPGTSQPRVERVSVVPAGATVRLDRLDLRLDAAVLANQLERQRAELRVTVRAGDDELVCVTADIDLLAYNEWPGLAVLPPLLATFVSPNHPALAVVLQGVADRLEAATGSRALDGYQSGDPQRARAMLQAVHEAVCARVITYVYPPPSFEQQGQKVRTPEQVLGDRLGTCLDLALLYAALLEHIGLQPLLVLENGHAFAGAWLVPASHPEAVLGPAVELRKRCDLGALAVVECTMACAGAARPFADAAASARKRLGDDARFQAAIDVGAARRLGITPMPVRTTAFAALEPEPGTERVEVGAATAAPAPAAQPAPRSEPPAEPLPQQPKDRLEHWKSKLLDLSMFNRLLNFVETKKVVPLCAHDLAALEDRLQQGGRLRVHARPPLAAADDPRDLEVASERAGVDLAAEYLAEELRAGRLRAELAEDELECRLVEIYRHARSTLEESGANTLHLAVGFLHWYETPQSTRLRRAPLLLLPLVAERSSVREGVRFVLDDAEPRLNQTLLQMLQRDFDLRLDLGDQPPEDEHGVDVAAVFTAFRRAALAMPRWEVVEQACIGFFSFTKYLMWLDLAARDELLASPVLRHLVETPGAEFEQEVEAIERERLDAIDPAEVFCPKDADSSQLAAVLAGAAGRTFVLEGPPGTGKSQTITNLIAQALASEKRVLFVAEKRAALEVVQRRLEEVGLAAFALELHSSKSGPRAVLDQLRRTLDFAAPREPAEWRRAAVELQRERQRLNAFVAALHTPREHGVSVYGALGRLVQLTDAPTVPLPGLPPADADRVAAARAAVADLAAAAGSLGVPCEEAWWGVQLGDWTPAIQRQVEPLAARLAAANERLHAAQLAFAAALGLETTIATGISHKQGELLLRLAELCNAASLPPGTLLTVADWPAVEAGLRAAVDSGRKRDELWAPLAARWRPSLLSLDLDALLVDYLRAVDAFFLVRWWRLRAPRRTLAAASLDGRVGSARAVREDLDRARSARDEQRRVAAAAAAAAALGSAWQGGQADWERVASWLDWVGAARQVLLQLVPGAVRIEPAVLEAVAARLDALAAGSEALPRHIAALRVAADEFEAALRLCSTLLRLDHDEAFAPPGQPGFADAIGDRVQTWLAALPRLRDHCAYVRAAAAAAADCEPLVVAHARGDLDTAELVACFEHTHLLAWLDGVHAAEPELARFRGVDHERAIAQFAALDRRVLELAAQVAAARLAARLPQVRDTNVASSELGILERELKKQRRHKPVRRLLAEVPNLLSRLAPCLLMSPLSVVQYLGRGMPSFDLVVFDEASQMPVWDAAPAIGRGRSLVVVGDSRQLPPTSFFQRLEQEDEPQEDDLPEDLESVLDECGAAGLPRMHLSWHYRSRHESLIAFSNHHYYDNRLLTFPAPAAVAPGRGVRLVRVPGVYDRGGAQHNRIEAEALVAEVVARLQDPERSRRSLGIVTFSRAQQQLVEDLLDRARAEHPQIEPFFAQAHEPVFVKNLENVQGDERDVILFSICYGPDAAGKLYENYGPINARGGERRLNVAVTRARYELVVFASMGAEQVANRSAALGARHLRAFLDYAERGEAALVGAVAVDARRDVESPFEAAVRDELVRRGHEVHTQIGCSGYRIDLAVVDPRAPGRYLLGIECDGATYHSAATARDRDRLRAAVLRGLGWRLCRVWSTDYWQDAAQEIARIETHLAEAMAEPVAPPPIEAPPPPPPAPIAAAVVPEPTPAESAPVPAPLQDPDGPRPYRAVHLSAAGTAEAFAAARAGAQIRAMVVQVLEGEAPITFDRLARTVAAAWDIGRVTEKVRERIRQVLPATAVEVNGMLWPDAAGRGSFTGFRVPDDDAATQRAADELPPIEVGNAMLWLLRQHGALGEDDLARETARVFGIQRLGSVVRAVMQGALDGLAGEQRVAREGGAVRAV